MTIGLYNRVRMTTATTGTGTITLGSAVANNFCTFGEAGVPTGKQVRYVIEQGTDFEIGIGTYTAAGTTLSRDGVNLSKIAGVAGIAKITLDGTAQVRIDIAAEDLNNGFDTKVISFTANIATAGNLAVTGVGFTPKAIVFFAAVPAGAGQFGFGMTDGTTSGEIQGRGNIQTDGMGTDTTCFDIVVSAGVSATYTLVSMDSDGFTLLNTLAGSPTGTVTVKALCIPT